MVNVSRESRRLLSMSEGGAMASQPGGRRDIVSQSTTTIRFPSATGRHAGPEADLDLSVYENLQAKVAS
jgi:hypothetical protein